MSSEMSETQHHDKEAPSSPAEGGPPQVASETAVDHTNEGDSVNGTAPVTSETAPSAGEKTSAEPNSTAPGLQAQAPFSGDADRESGNEPSRKPTPPTSTEEDSDEDQPKPVRKAFLDLNDFTTFWSRVASGFSQEYQPNKLNIFLDAATDALEKALEGELDEEHIEYLEKSALRSVVIAIVTRPGNWSSTFKPKANTILMLASEYILSNLDSADVNHLIQTLHRIYLNSAEHCPFYTRQTKEEVHEDLAKKYLPTGMTPVGNSMSETDTTNMSPQDMDAAWRATTSWVRISRSERSVSPLYYININHLGSMNGFARIFDYIRDTKELQLFTLKLFIKVLCVMRYSMSLSFLKVFLPCFVDLCCSKLLEWFGVNLKPDLRTHYQDSITFLGLMLQEIMTEEQAAQRFDAYTLEGCLMLFNTDNLEKRLKGLRDVKTMIERTQKNEGNRIAGAIGKWFQSPQQDEEEDKKKKQPKIRPETLIAWLEEHAFMDLFFTMLKSHIEILRQGTPILIFVAQQKKLSLEHLENIWAMSATMHEHDKRILNSSLVALVPHLPPSHLDHLITRISESPLQSIDEQVVDLVVSLTTLSVAADTKHKWNGLELLWKLYQDPVAAPSAANAASSSNGTPSDSPGNKNPPVAGSSADGGDTADSQKPKKTPKTKVRDGTAATAAAAPAIDPLLAHKAFTKLCELLTTEECAPQRPIFLERCFVNLEEHRSVALSMEIMRRCIDAYPVRRRKKAVTDLESKKKLITLIFEDFHYYKEAASKMLEQEQASAAAVHAPSALPASSAATSALLDPRAATPTPTSPSLTPPVPKKRRKSATTAEETGVSSSSLGDTTPRAVTPAAVTTPCSQQFDVNAMMVFGRSHLENVTQRLAFLEYVIVNAALSMKNEQLDTLWDLFISQALSAAEREATFGWLERASTPAGDFVVLPEAQLQHLFNAKMLTMSAAALTTAGYHLFERYFCRINESLGKVKFAEERNDKSIGLVSPDAVGLDKLWEIALENDDRQVNAAAVSCLNQLHLNLELFMNRTKAIKIRESYVQYALEKLSKANGATTEGHMERTLRLLMECVEEYEELKGESATAASASNTNAGLLSGWVFGDVFGGGKRGAKNNVANTTVKVFLKSAGKSPQRLVLNVNTTIRAISEKAAELFNFDIYDTLKLTVEEDKDKELKELDKTLNDYKIADDATIVVRKVLEPVEGPNGEGPSIFSTMLQALTLGVGGVGATTDQVRALLSRADNVLKQTGGPAAAANNANKPGSITAKNERVAPHAPMFTPIQRASQSRPIRLTDDKTRELHPARILCSPQHFAKLYDLLATPDDAIGVLTWELLTMLPRSDAKVADLEAITDKKGIATHLPHDHPFQSLYNLQLLETLIAKSYEPDSDGASTPIATVGRASPAPRSAGASSSAVDKVWRTSLLNAGILEHVLDKLFSIKLSDMRASSQKTVATYKLLPQLLRVINWLALEVSNEKKLSRVSSLNLSRNLHSQRTSQTGRFVIATNREHFSTSNATSFDEFISDLIAKLLRLTTSLSSSANLSSVDMEDDALIIQEALTLLVPLVTSSSVTFERFLGDDNFRNWLLALILKNPNLKARESAVRALADMINFAAPGQVQTSLILLELLLPYVLDDTLDSYASSCDEFFLAVELLLRDVAATPYHEPVESSGKKEKKSSSEPAEPAPSAHPVLLDLVKKLNAKIEARPVVEKFAPVGNEDRILIGMMQLVYSIVHRDGAATAGKKSRAPLYKGSCRSLVKEIFHMCLFAIPTAERRGPDAPPKCKTKASRTIAYVLLTELCSHCDRNLNTILRLLQEQVSSIDMREDYTFYTGRNEKSTTGYVGLQNQGATCYMNATMQQLYMVNEFRQGIFASIDQSFANPIESVLKLPPEKKKKKGVLGPSPYYHADESDDDDAEAEQTPKWDESTALAKLQKESVLYQLQRMFAFLQEGERRSFDTRHFCYSYKDFEGNPVNTAQQMDANEYFNRLFDTLEGKLAGSPQAQLLQSIFGGKYANQLLGTGTECQHRRESTEPFYSISVDIKHKTSLQDSLKSFIEGEVLSGENKFQCSKCAKPVDTLKRCLMHSLPPILVIHLKRFEFHYEQMRHYKLNSSCSFPTELDMEPYMRESFAAKEFAKMLALTGDASAATAAATDGAADDDQTESLSDLINLAQARKAAGYYDYELSGVVVHVGSSDAGHYYSFIKERPQSLPPGRVRDSTVGSKWYEFNDSYVTEFDPAKIPLECFGGEDEVMEFTDETRTTKRLVKRPRTNNAYILIYQRKTHSSESSDSALSVSKAPGHSRNPSTGGAIGSETVAIDDAEVEELSEKTLTASRKTLPPLESHEATSPDHHPSDVTSTSASTPTVSESNGNPATDHKPPIVLLNGEANSEHASSAPTPVDGSAPATANAASSAPSEVSTSPAKVHGADEIFDSIYEENRIFILRKHLFDPDYFNFVWSIVNANLPPIPQRTPDELRCDREESQRKSDVSRMYRERQELERETNAFPSPFVPRMMVNPNLPAPPGPRTLTVGSGPNAIKIEVRATNPTPASLKQDQERRAKERKEEEKRRAKEKTVDADEQRLEQDKKADAAEKAAKDEKASKKAAKDAKKTAAPGDAKKKSSGGEEQEGSGEGGKKKKKKDTTENSSMEESDISSSSSQSTKADLTTFALDFIKNIYVHARETPLLNLWLTTLYRLYAANLGKARALLRGLVEDPGEMQRQLLVIHSEKARTCHAQMIVAAMRALAPKENAQYVATAVAISKGTLDRNKEPASYCVWFLEELWRYQKIARRNHFDSFFYIFAQFANFGPQERRYLLKRSYMMDVIHFALFFEPASTHSKVLSTPRSAATEMFHLSDFISTLLLGCHAEVPDKDDLHPPTALNRDSPYSLGAKEHPYALGYLFNNLLMREDVNSHAVGRVFCHFCWENADMTKWVISNITRGLLESTLSSQSRGYMDVLCYVVKNLSDSLDEMRMKLILDEFPKWLARYRNNHRAGSERIIQSFFIMATLNPILKEKVMANKNSLNHELESAGYRIL